MTTPCFQLSGCAFAALLCQSFLQPVHAQEAIPLGSEVQRQAEEAILRALDTRFSARFTETPLTEALDAMGRAGNIQMRIDVKSLEDAGAGADTPVTKMIDNISLRSSLEIMLRPMDLAWIIVNESLVVTTKERVDADLRVVVYPVRDLVTTRRNSVRSDDFDSLIDGITTTISPTTWDEVGGPGSIAEYRMTKSLIVSQTREVHEQIAALLAALRESGDLQGIAPVFPRPPRSAASGPQSVSFERPRYEIAPDAGWLLPRTHEFSR